MFTFDIVDRAFGAIDCCPWGASTGRPATRIGCSPRAHLRHVRDVRRRPLYTQDQRQRRDASPWTLVQGVLAPMQFAVFLISLTLVLRYLATGEGYALATGSIVVKTVALYTIMVTGSIWERDVFGRFLFAPAFFWEDVVSMLVLALHTAYLIGLFSGAMDAERQMWLALAAYASYVVNATQFVLKLRAARKQEAMWPAGAVGHVS